eukprot:CAMPEP_0202853164 /NCGR_PEP_ID=MMETSP1389-20130828/90342_1 /ASSEMBLY_ACC=CAM_ASM_000865 /TAXON_ID=302021 /ORGANISM="Rhodomonas sp., Strain CCMP768" /LENGTH=355 /DNA_ID=CAMNT_0049531707 /DNA_START=45 /DNA_END=1113 /DNA_ORIENTATION=-
MGRPSASPENRAFSIFFAHAITKKSNSRLDFVARSGPLSLFSALHKMFPAYARTEDGQGFRDGVSEVQLNKELQKNGFERVRDRRTCAIRKSDDPIGAGMYMFSHLQWKDPSQPEEREVLIQWHAKMVEKFPLIMLSCKLDKFLRVVGEFQQAWAQRTEAMSVEDVETEAESEPHSAQRSTSVSPALQGVSAHHALMQMDKFLRVVGEFQQAWAQRTEAMSVEDVETEAESEPHSAQRSTSVSPALQGAEPTPLLASIRLLASGCVHTPPTASVGMLKPAPLLPSLGCGMQTTQQNLAALQSQLTSSLLAVALAKQQLQQAEHLSFHHGTPLQPPLMQNVPAHTFSPFVLPMQMS